MYNLTDSQLKALSHAAQRDDGAANFMEVLKGGAATKVGKALIARKLVREVKTKTGMPVWRRDAEGRLFSLVISSAGRKAISVADGDGAGSATGVRDQVKAPSGVGSAGHQSERISRRKTATPRDGVQARALVGPPTLSVRAGTKKALLIEMLSGSAGASIGALMGATGWLPHTTRAALTGLRQAGCSIERSKGDGGVSVYRLLRARASRDRANVSSDRRGAIADRA